jgi:outer membrane protein TolC
MRLAGARNDDIAIARTRHAEAIAQSRSAWQRFWPSLSLAAASRGHNGRVQDIGGALFDANKQQYTLGGALLVDWSPGEIYFAALAANQRALAAAELAEASRRSIILQSINRYYDLLAAEASLAVAADDLTLTENYAAQLNAAVSSGTAFRSDFLRATIAATRLKLALRKSEETRDLAAAALAESLRLPADSQLRPAKSDLVPVPLSPPASIPSLLAQASSNRPELRAAAADLSAARINSDRARIAPLLPSVNAGYGLAGLGGGIDNQWKSPRDSHDFFLGLSWKIGPGGLFDSERKKIAAAEQDRANLQSRSLHAAISKEVVSAATRAASAADQIRLNDQAVTDASEMVSLASQRLTSELGAVLEVLLAQEEATRARIARITAVTDYNKAQHELHLATGH